MLHLSEYQLDGKPDPDHRKGMQIDMVSASPHDRRFEVIEMVKYSTVAEILPTLTNSC